MERISFTTPYPPSVNRIYATSSQRMVSKPKINKFGQIVPGKPYYPRVLTKEAKAFKKYVSELLFYTFPKVKYGRHPVDIDIVVFPPDDKRTRDDHNIEKILYDAIEMSGIIDNDKQIVKRSICQGKKVKGGSLNIVMKPYIEETKS